MATDINSIVCEKCNTRYRYDASKIPAGGRKMRCSTCGHIFLAMPRTIVAGNPVTPGEGGDDDESELQLEEEENASKKPAAEPKKDEKKKRILLRQDGTRYAVADTATLQRWIVERRISREAELSLDGEVWEKVSERMDLAPFFSIVERNRKGRGKGETQANIPIQPAQPNASRKREGRDGGVKSANASRESGPAPSAPTPGPTTSGSLAFANKDTLKELNASRAANNPNGYTAASSSTVATSPASPAAASSAAAGVTASASNVAASSTAAASPAASAKESTQAASSAAPVPPVAATKTVTAAAPPVPAVTKRDPGQASPAREATPVAPAPPPGMPVGAKVLYALVAILLLVTIAYVMIKPHPQPGSGAGAEPAESPLAAPSPAIPPSETGGNGGAAGTAGNPSTGGTSASSSGTSGKTPATDKAGAEKVAAEKAAAEKVAAEKVAAEKAAAEKVAAEKAAAEKGTAEKAGATPKPSESKSADTGKPGTPPGATEPAPKSSANVTALLKAGYNHLKNEKFAEAVASFREAAELSPGDARVWNELGWALHHQSQGDYRQQDSLRNQSVAAFQKALELNRRLADAYYGLGVLHQEMGQRADAARYFRLALDNNLKGKDSINEVRGFLSQLESQGYTGN